MTRALIALLVLAAVAPAVPARDVPSTIEACIRQLDSERDVGFDRIAALCPELAPALKHGPVSAWLPSDWDVPGNQLSSGGLEELRSLIATESARTSPASGPNVADVAGILRQLAAPAASHLGWWDRFKAWLHEVLSAPRATPQRSWLATLIEALAGRGGWFWIAIAALALVALLAGIIIVTELRAAGVLRSRPRAAARAPGARDDERRAAWQRIEAAAPAEQPRLLLELIAARLAQQDRLPPARALTVHELLRSARLAHENDRARLRDLAATSEQLRFSGRGVSGEQLNAALARGRELLEVLEAAPA